MTEGQPLSPEIVSRFKKAMGLPPASLLCAAPFNNIAFNTQGYAGVCFQSYFYEEHLRYPNATIREIWFSEEFQRLREGIRRHDLEYKCGQCKRFLEDGNFTAAPINGYNRYRESLSEYPTTMEFELSNNCNLECVMCIGSLSAKIRRNREKLPPLRNPYDRNFVEQLREFIPHVQEMKFLGGEPLLIKHYYQIWDLTLGIRPGTLFFVTTNGTTLTDRFKGILARGNFQISLSLDSMVEETYRKIRIGSDFKTVFRHLEYYRDYHRARKGALHVTVNPMRMNWQEIPEFINFGNRQGIKIWLHTVERPEDLALWSLPARDLERIIERLGRARIVAPRGVDEHVLRENRDVFDAFLNKQLVSWHQQALRRERAPRASTEASACST
jgi:MoaA/NifB/PqqE/SkfB family radical SAM enzyme